tara:strand:+ start:531 stop:917 length:387 start_codon:yes stop_codon:yes gene_type:complete
VTAVADTILAASVATPFLPLPPSPPQLPGSVTSVTSTATDLLRPHGTLALARFWKPALRSAAAGRNAEQAEQALAHAPGDAVTDQQHGLYSTLRRDLTELGAVQAISPHAARLCRAPAIPFSGALALR